MCCCKPANLFHDESIKFVLHAAEPKHKEVILFQNYPDGPVE